MKNIDIEALKAFGNVLTIQAVCNANSPMFSKGDVYSENVKQAEKFAAAERANKAKMASDGKSVAATSSKEINKPAEKTFEKSEKGALQYILQKVKNEYEDKDAWRNKDVQESLSLIVLMTSLDYTSRGLKEKIYTKEFCDDVYNCFVEEFSENAGE